jgi:SOS-response transcriptional repressor LexA
MAETTTSARIAGDIEQGAPLQYSKETVMLPAAILEAYEQVYRVADASLSTLDLFEGDLLIVEPRRKAQTGELVIVRLDAQFFIGRWWAKHGRRDIVGDDGHTVIVSGATVLGSINLIVRRQ